MDEQQFDMGMGLLSGAFDWDGVPESQVRARQTAYWVVLKHFSGDVFLRAVALTIQTRRETVRPDGTRIRPTFPPAADLFALCRDLAADRQRALPPPAVTPAPPDVAQRHIREIKARLRAARGPLAATIREVVDGDGGPALPPTPTRDERDFRQGAGR